MSQKSVIRKGDTTSHGGVVLEGIDNYPIMGTPVACKGHMVSCPKCKGTYPIIEGLPYAPVEGRQMAVEGMKTGCGAELIATQSVYTYEWVPGGTAAMTSLVGADALDQVGGIVITSETEASLPKNEDRTDIGVGEGVILRSEQVVESWLIEPANMGRIEKQNEHVATFLAYDQAGAVTIIGTGPDGKGAIRFTILAPIKMTMKRDPEIEILHYEGMPDCGWVGQAHFLPSHVNFYNIQFREVDTQATGTGFFAASNGQYHGGTEYVNGYSKWADVSRADHTDDGSFVSKYDIIYVDVRDDIPLHSTNVPFVEGLFTMDIIWQWRIKPQKMPDWSIHDLPLETQYHQIFSDGRSITYKAGHQEECLYSAPDSNRHVLDQLNDEKELLQKGRAE